MDEIFVIFDDEQFDFGDVTIVEDVPGGQVIEMDGLAGQWFVSDPLDLHLFFV